MTSNVRALSISAGLVAMLCLGRLNPDTGHAEQPPPPCHPNPNEATDVSTVAIRADVASLPMPLKDRLLQLASRPHTYLPQQAFAEATTSSRLFQYYLLDTHGFEPNEMGGMLRFCATPAVREGDRRPGEAPPIF